MSTGSTHCNFGRTCWRLMVVASSRFWMSILRRSASSRTTPVKRQQPRILGQRRRVVQDGGGAEDRGERRAQFVRHRADQRFAQQLGLRAHLGLVERARDVEPLQRGGGVGQRVVDALAHVGQRLARDVAEIDGDQAEIGRLRRHAANEPDIALAVVDGALEPFVVLDARRPRRAPSPARRRRCRRRRRRAARPCAAPDWRDDSGWRRKSPPRSAPRRAGARTRRDRSSRARACGRSWCGAWPGWTSCDTTTATTMNRTRLSASCGEATWKL